MTKTKTPPKPYADLNPWHAMSEATGKMMDRQRVPWSSAVMVLKDVQKRWPALDVKLDRWMGGTVREFQAGSWSITVRLRIEADGYHEEVREAIAADLAERFGLEDPDVHLSRFRVQVSAPSTQWTAVEAGSMARAWREAADFALELEAMLGQGRVFVSDWDEAFPEGEGNGEA